MKFVLFVEGQTEQKTIGSFLKRWLDSRLSQPVGIKSVRFDGWPELIRKMPKKASMYLEGPDSKDIIAVIGLLDLYGPTFYPDSAATAQEKLAWGRKELEGKVENKRFKMFFAVHEFEAWLLSQPNVFTTNVAKSLETKSERPEDINFDNPPSKLLESLYKQQTKRNYKKIVDGNRLFAKLDPELTAKKCPELRNMLESMLEMAKKAYS